MISRDLMDSAENIFLLHGDLHHGNILSSGNEWKLIDPKGVAGDPAFEVGAWIRNPSDRILSVPNLDQLIDRRLRILSEVADLDLARCRRWAFVSCMLSACWSADDRTEGWDEALTCARDIEPMIKN